MRQLFKKTDTCGCYIMLPRIHLSNSLQTLHLISFTSDVVLQWRVVFSYTRNMFSTAVYGILFITLLPGRNKMKRKEMHTHALKNLNVPLYKLIRCILIVQDPTIVHLSQWSQVCSHVNFSLDTAMVTEITSIAIKLDQVLPSWACKVHKVTYNLHWTKAIDKTFLSLLWLIIR